MQARSIFLSISFCFLITSDLEFFPISARGHIVLSFPFGCPRSCMKFLAKLPPAVLGALTDAWAGFPSAAQSLPPQTGAPFPFELPSSAGLHIHAPSSQDGYSPAKPGCPPFPRTLLPRLSAVSLESPVPMFDAEIVLTLQSLLTSPL